MHRRGERRTSVSDEPDSLRPGVEDLVGAGAIIRGLRDRRLSVEAGAALAAFESAEASIAEELRRCISDEN